MEEPKTIEGLGITGVLTLIFIVLKLVGIVDWPWLIVLSPTLISIAIGLLIFFCFGIYCLFIKK